MKMLACVMISALGLFGYQCTEPANRQQTDAEALPATAAMLEPNATTDPYTATEAPPMAATDPAIVSDKQATTIDPAGQPVVRKPTPLPVKEQPAPSGDLNPATTTQTPTTPTEPAKPAAPQPPDHDQWNTQLRQYVTAQGSVDYTAWKKNETDLDTYLDVLADNPPQSGWSRNEQMAYWINTYNAFTVKLILKNWPVKKITDLHGGKPWDVKWIELGDKTYSLNQIENDILRPKYGDARIHFAVNCAAVSCPPLLNAAYTAANLTSRLEANAKAFINNDKYNVINGDKVQVSKIFDWYGSDFNGVTAYLNKYATDKIPDNTPVTFMEYNWALNGR